MKDLSFICGDGVCKRIVSEHRVLKWRYRGRELIEDTIEYRDYDDEGQHIGRVEMVSTLEKMPDCDWPIAVMRDAEGNRIWPPLMSDSAPGKNHV